MDTGKKMDYAFVTFEKKEQAALALDYGEIIIDIATIQIQKAVKRMQQPRE